MRCSRWAECDDYLYAKVWANIDIAKMLEYGLGITLPEDVVPTQVTDAIDAWMDMYGAEWVWSTMDVLHWKEE